MSSFDEGDENDGTTIYRPSNYYSDCLDMPADMRPVRNCPICNAYFENEDDLDLHWLSHEVGD
jgi:hypothetical protein